jgi:hypothetical protein
MTVWVLEMSDDDGDDTVLGVYAEWWQAAEATRRDQLRTIAEGVTAGGRYPEVLVWEADDLCLRAVTWIGIVHLQAAYITPYEVQTA